MRPGVLIWVIGSADRLAAAGAAIRAAVSDHVAFVDVISEDEIREHLCTHEKEGADVRALAAERTGWVCHLLERNGGAGIALSHGSKRAERDALRKKAGGMIEVLLKGALPAGLEPPYYPDVELDGTESEQDIRARIEAALKAIGLLDESSRRYDEDEERLVKERLEKLGYL